MFKYVTINGDVYVKTDRLTARIALERFVAKCRYLRISAYNLFHLLRTL